MPTNVLPTRPDALDWHAFIQGDAAAARAETVAYYLASRLVYSVFGTAETTPAPRRPLASETNAPRVGSFGGALSQYVITDDIDTSERTYRHDLIIGRISGVDYYGIR